jgi:ribosomal protein L28
MIMGTGTSRLNSTKAASMGIPATKQSHSKTHTQKQQHQNQQQHRYSRQNQEEVVLKMVQNIFKLLETRECTIINFH